MARKKRSSGSSTSSKKDGRQRGKTESKINRERTSSRRDLDAGLSRGSRQSKRGVGESSFESETWNPAQPHETGRRTSSRRGGRGNQRSGMYGQSPAAGYQPSWTGDEGQSEAFDQSGSRRQSGRGGQGSQRRQSHSTSHQTRQDSSRGYQGTYRSRGQYPAGSTGFRGQTRDGYDNPGEDYAYYSEGRGGGEMYEGELAFDERRNDIGGAHERESGGYGRTRGQHGRHESGRTRHSEQRWSPNEGHYGRGSRREQKYEGGRSHEGWERDASSRRQSQRGQGSRGEGRQEYSRDYEREMSDQSSSRGRGGASEGYWYEGGSSRGQRGRQGYSRQTHQAPAFQGDYVRRRGQTGQGGYGYQEDQYYATGGSDRTDIDDYGDSSFEGEMYGRNRSRSNEYEREHDTMYRAPGSEFEYRDAWQRGGEKREYDYDDDLVSDEDRGRSMSEQERWQGGAYR